MPGSSNVLKWFQSTRPREPRRGLTGTRRPCRSFNPRGHASRDPPPRATDPPAPSFNPRGHASRDAVHQVRDESRHAVSIHAATRAATRRIAAAGAGDNRFNPRGHASRDHMASLVFAFHSLFQSTRPREPRRRYWTRCTGLASFNPRGHASRDTTHLRHRNRSKSFNPRGHASRDATLEAIRRDGKVSIHAATRAATRSANATDTLQRFNPRGHASRDYKLVAL